MVDELGVEPGRDAAELERAILRHDPALDAETTRRTAHRGAVVCVGARPLGLVGAARPGERAVLVELVAGRGRSLRAGRRAARARPGARLRARTACFTSDDPVADLVRLATEQEAELLVVGRAPSGLLAGRAVRRRAARGGREPFAPEAPVLVPFGGGGRSGRRSSSAPGSPARTTCRCACSASPRPTAARDASRMLASASLALQRFAGTAAETALVAPGADGILAERGSAIVASLPRGALDATRLTLAERAPVPVLLVHGGLHPGGLAPDRTLTRFSWSLADG